MDLLYLKLQQLNYLQILLLYHQQHYLQMLNVSSQSVSRWELGICYPDMELLPMLAEIFEITVDKLLGIGIKILL